MKAVAKTGMLLLALALFSGAYAKDEGNKKLKDTMHNFSLSLELIQGGIFYNKMDEMNKGVNLLQKNQKDFMKIHGDELKKHFPEDKEFAYEYAKLITQRIGRLTNKMVDSLNGKDVCNISTVYGDIAKECICCHQRVRKQ